MNKYQYLKQPGLLYDMMFALKLRFNGERAYKDISEKTPLSEETKQLYNQVISQLSEISVKLLPLFYWNDSPKKKTALLAYMRHNMYRFHYTEEGLIDEFYDSLRDVQNLKRFVYTNYVSEECPEVIDINTFDQIRESLYAADLPDDVKMYMIDFFLYGEKEIEFIINELRKVQSVCQGIYDIYADKVKEQIGKFDDSKIAALSKLQMWDITQYEPIYHTYTILDIYSTYGETYNSDYVVYLGFNSDESVFEYTDIDINLYELGRILYDETRLKILYMLKEKPMYCAEIAKVLGLKNNSTLYHLSMMEKQNLICTYPTGKKIYYRINLNYIDSIKIYLNDIKWSLNNEKL